jgi:hypothetical protein
MTRQAVGLRERGDALLRVILIRGAGDRPLIGIAELSGFDTAIPWPLTRGAFCAAFERQKRLALIHPSNLAYWWFFQ